MFAWLFVVWVLLLAGGVFGLAEWDRLGKWGQALTVVAGVLVVVVGVAITGVLV